MELPVTVLFEDNHCLVLSKPAGLLTQGVPPGIPTLEAQAKAYLKHRFQKPGNVYLGIPHRLDRPVSGVVLFARNSKSARRLAEQFREHQVQKVYWAVVEDRSSGQELAAEGAWEDWLRKIAEHARTEKASPGSDGAKHAVLHYRKLQTLSRGTLLEIRPQTGRMHQIRVQASLRGRPILGDVIYGATQPFGPAAELPRDRVIALHARSLTFLHPIRYEPVQVVAPLPATWRELGIPE